jgi:hypothetical protein
VVDDPGYFSSVSGDRAPLPHGGLPSAIRNRRPIAVASIRAQIDHVDCDLCSRCWSLRSLSGASGVISGLGCLERERGDEQFVD